MIGHNEEKIDIVIKSIERGYGDLGVAIGNSWPGVTEVLQQEWIGPDERSFEEQLANKLIELYRACKQSFVDMAANVTAIGKGWIEFQNNNIISGATMGTREYTFYQPSFDSYDIEYVLSVDAFDPSTAGNYGIVNGKESATAINSKLDTLITAINDKLTEMKTSFIADGAFLGANQAETIEGYFASMTNYVGNLIGLVNELQPVLKQLVDAYDAQATAFNTSVNATAESINSAMPSSNGPTA